MSTTLSLGLASALLPEHVSRTLAPTETLDQASHLLMEGVQALRGQQQQLTPPPPAMTSAVSLQSLRSLRSRPSPAVGEPSGTADAVSPIRVFVLSVPQSLTSDLLHCYQKARGQWPWDDSVPHGDCDKSKRRTCKHCVHGNACSESLGVEVAQHASDVWLHKALLAHPGRTQIASEADVIFVPFYGGISYELGMCKGMDHHDRVKHLADTILNSPLWPKAGGSTDMRPGWRFALAVSHWRVPVTLASPLRELLVNSRAVVLTQDTYFFDHTRGVPDLYGDSTWKVPGWGCRTHDSRYVVTIPYPSVNPARPNRRVNRQLSVTLADQSRTKLVYFRGNTALSSCRVREKSKMRQPEFCRLRSKLVAAAVSSCAAADLDILNVDKIREHSFGYAKNFSTRRLMEGMRQSTFCLVPRGDTPSSRRVFDAVAAGCIPVLIADDYTPPFEELDWPGFSVRLDLGNAVADPCQVFEQLRRIPAAEVSQKLARLREVAPMLSYGHWSAEGIHPGGAIDLALAAVQRAVARQEAGDVSESVCGDHDRPSSNSTTIALNTEKGPSGQIFVIFARPRTASTTLCDHLNQQPEVTMLYELLSFRHAVDDPFGIKRFRCELGYCVQAAWEADLPGFMRAVAAHCPTRFCGFKMFDKDISDKDMSVENIFGLGGQATKMIVLERKDVDAEYQSVTKAWATGNWESTPCLEHHASRRHASPRLLGAADTFNTSVQDFRSQQSQWYSRVRSFASHGPQLELTTENFVAHQGDVVSRALEFLGVRAAPGTSILAEWAVCTPQLDQ